MCCSNLMIYIIIHHLHCCTPPPNTATPFSPWHFAGSLDLSVCVTDVHESVCGGGWCQLAAV